jgi:hypothetical protein
MTKEIAALGAQDGLESILNLVDSSYCDLFDKQAPALLKESASDPTKTLYAMFRFLNEQCQALRSELRKNFGVDSVLFETFEGAQRIGALSASMTLMQALRRPRRQVEDCGVFVRRVC